MIHQPMFERVVAVLLALLPVVLWCAWFLWAVNWKKLNAAIADGAWAPFVLLMLLIAGVWSRIYPSDGPISEYLHLSNFWWQFGVIAALVALAMLCGWVQNTLHWTPAEIDLNPPAHADHGHGHSHEHGHAHGDGHDHGQGHGHGHGHH